MARFDTVDQVLVSSDRARVHEAGWQSWSPTGTYRLDERSARPEQAWQQLMRFRPESPAPSSGFQSEGVLAIDAGDGRTRVYAPAPSRNGGCEVPTIRARLRERLAVVTADGPVSIADVEGTIDDALVAFADEWASRCGVAAITRPPTVWCSWYHYFLDVEPGDIAENLAAMGRLDLPVDVVQVDDGWQAGIGDWDAYSERFRGLADLVALIRDSGRRAGIWVAPLVVGSASRLAQEHPDWLVGDAGHNWGQSLHGLDVTNPAAAAHLGASLQALRDLGIDYVKLDFLYAGAVVGRRHDDVSPVMAYRRGLALVRQALGDEAYLVGCGAPILPSVGLVDAMRVSADVINPADPATDSTRPRGEQAIRARAWQQGRFWVNDPDCLVARPGFPLRRQWAHLVEDFGGLRSVSDRIDDLDPWGLATTRRLLSSGPGSTPLDRSVLGQTP